jgi:imidazolonepropionase-like amidohydrolase
MIRAGKLDSVLILALFRRASPAFAEHHELEMMVAAGLTPMHAIMCATKTNAELLGIEKTTGTLTVGKQADLIVLDGNPLDDIRNSGRWLRSGTGAGKCSQSCR